MPEPDLMEYPDSGRRAAVTGAAPGGDAARRTFSSIVRADAEVDYRDGEA